MPSILSLLHGTNTKSDYEELAETMFNQIGMQNDQEEKDLKTHVDACAKRFKLLTVLDLHNLGEIHKLKKWVVLGALLVLFGKYVISLIISLLKGMTFMDALQLFLSL